MLSEFEVFFLLALDDEKGSITKTAKTSFPMALAGTLLAELALLGKVCINDKDRLVAQPGEPTGDPILDEAFQEIQDSPKPRKLTYWVSQFSAQPKKLRERVAEGLVKKGLIFREDKHYFRQPQDEIASPSAKPDAADLAPSRYQIKLPLRAMILAGEPANARALALLTVISACDLLNLVFTADEIRPAGQIIQQHLLRAALETPNMQAIEVLAQALAISLEND